ncbi:MAG: alpha/beta fold hydrolase [Candidatus Sumerlaeaceae bacterium]|nr:alpha/beta fold hydrolase [Candidatus Sumerlaeaceae bacterium]
MGKEIVTFASGRFGLGGVWDIPPRHPPYPAVICCHGFTGHHIEARRLYSRLARMLCEAGIAVFRFDHRGCGDSSGDFLDFTPMGFLEDLDAAEQFFLSDPRIEHSRIAVVGYSLGGISASYLLSRHPDWRTGVLWAGVARPDIIRDRLAQYPAFEGYEERGYMDYGGFRVSKAYIDEIGWRTKPVEWLKAFPGPVLFCHGEDDDIVRVEQSHLFLHVRNQSGDELIVFPGADHGFSSCDVIDDLLSATLTWVGSKLDVKVDC